MFATLDSSDIAGLGAVLHARLWGCVEFINFNEILLHRTIIAFVAAAEEVGCYVALKHID